MSKKRTLDQKNSRRKFLQGGVALGAMAPVLFANNVQAHGSRLKDNKDQEYVIVSIVATHPFWNDLKNGAQDAADDLGVKFSYVGPAGFDVEGQVFPGYYTVEMRIPLSTINFPKGVSSWRFNFFRIDPSENQKTTWAKIPQQFKDYNLAFMGNINFEKPLGESNAKISVIPFVNSI